MTELQEKIFEVMQALDGLCKREGLTCYMLGGTMLGAIRHKGFIPWDDDADFGLPRADYEKLLRLSKDSIPKGFRLRSYRTEAGAPYAFARLEHEGTTLLETRRSGSGYVGGVYVDIFPLDGDSEKKSVRTFREKKIWLLKKLLYAHIAPKNLQKSAPKKALMAIVRGVTKRERLVKKLDESVMHFSKGDKAAKRYSNYLGHWGKKESVPKSFFTGDTDAASGVYSFEGVSFAGPADYDAYLTALYGADYMTIPPQKDRQSHPAEFVDLQKPFAKSQKPDKQ